MDLPFLARPVCLPVSTMERTTASNTSQEGTRIRVSAMITKAAAADFGRSGAERFTIGQTAVASTPPHTIRKKNGAMKRAHNTTHAASTAI